jgi:hypothetical protein
MIQPAMTTAVSMTQPAVTTAVSMTQPAVTTVSMIQPVTVLAKQLPARLAPRKHSRNENTLE